MNPAGASARHAMAATSSGMSQERNASPRSRVTAHILADREFESGTDAPNRIQDRLLRDHAQLAQQLAVDVCAGVEHQPVLELLKLVHPEHHDDAGAKRS
jgi:hypothetical protein